MKTYLSLCLAVALAVAGSPAGAQMADAPPPAAAAAMPLPAPPAEAPAASSALLRPPVEAARPPLHYEITALQGSRSRLRPFDRYLAVGMAIGGTLGFAYGMTQRDTDAFGLSPVIETAIGAGIGGYAGAALYLMKSTRAPPVRRFNPGPAPAPGRS
ncbi:MAG: hypothetical protein KY444_01075 [Gemmatimonadetes bacterium]|nr:hypothetical protein [Gemmatimonadota bacterium]